MNIVVLAGGISTERDVSLCSGRKVYEALKRLGHNAILLDVFLGYSGSTDEIFEIDKDWAAEVAPIAFDAPDIEAVKASRKGNPNVLFGENVLTICDSADIVFMALHGDCGENGKIQATFDLFGIKYTGTDALSSALAMDKAVTKNIFVTNNVLTPRSILIKEKNYDNKLGYPCVVKVNAGGSSVGVYIVNNEAEYKEAVDNAFLYDEKIIIEEYIKGREFTDCVIEGEALPIVEIVPKSGFYDYKNKYQAGSTIETCPADIDKELEEKIKSSARAAYEALGIRTYARMDFIVDEDNNVYCLEANTLPGMTPTSLVPQEAAAIGKSFDQLCEWIIDISMKKYQ